jgi:hypothetical protein
VSTLSANLAHRILNDNLPWDRSVELHIDAFLEKYTLHDSLWIGLFADCGFEDAVIAVVRFDPVWNSSVSAPTSVCADWPLLFLRFKSASVIRLSAFRDIGGIQRGISGVDVEHLSGEEVRTVISDHYGASVSVQHFPLIDALALSPDENVLGL